MYVQAKGRINSLKLFVTSHQIHVKFEEKKHSKTGINFSM